MDKKIVHNFIEYRFVFLKITICFTEVDKCIVLYSHLNFPYQYSS